MMGEMTLSSYPKRKEAAAKVTQAKMRNGLTALPDVVIAPSPYVVIVGPWPSSWCSTARLSVFAWITASFFSSISEELMVVDVGQCPKKEKRKKK